MKINDSSSQELIAKMRKVATVPIKGSEEDKDASTHTQRRLKEMTASFEKTYGHLDEQPYWDVWHGEFPRAVISAEGNRLTAALDDLAARGYFTAQNFGCCSNCAMRAIREEKKAEQTVFYDTQGFEYLLEAGEVYLYWRGDPHEIIRALKRHGLTVEWNGNSKSTILVKELFASDEALQEGQPAAAGLEPSGSYYITAENVVFQPAEAGLHPVLQFEVHLFDDDDNFVEMLGSFSILNGRLALPHNISRTEVYDGSKAVYLRDSPEGHILDALEDQGIRKKFLDVLSWPIVMEEPTN